MPLREGESSHPERRSRHRAHKQNRLNHIIKLSVDLDSFMSIIMNFACARFESKRQATSARSADIRKVHIGIPPSLRLELELLTTAVGRRWCLKCAMNAHRTWACIKVDVGFNQTRSTDRICDIEARVFFCFWLDVNVAPPLFGRRWCLNQVRNECAPYIDL